LEYGFECGLEMKFAILLCSALAVASASDCISSFKSYLDCIAKSTGDPSKGKVLEQEFDDDFVTLVGRCFDASDNNGANTKCILSRANLDTDVFGPDGPLATCDKCREYAVEIKNKIFNAPENVRACFREKFSAAVVNDLQPCIRTELGDQTFNIPPLPDFDKSTKDFMDLVLKGMSHRVMTYSRLGACKERYSSRAQTSSSCLDNAKGLYPKHCALSQTCKTSSVSADCNDKFTKTKKATCKCLDTKRDEWHQRLDKVHDAVFNPEHSSTVCASGVKAALGHWIQDFQDIFKACVPDAAPDPNSKIPNLPLSKLIDAGCIQAVEAAADDSKQKQLNAGFRMVRYILDALNDRVTNFCSVDCF